MFTTLLYQLYPPLKGFSHSLDTHTRCESAPLPAAFQGVLQPKAFEMLHKWGLLIEWSLNARKG